MHPKADAYIAKENQWQKEFELMRTIALETGMEEDFKWGHPCYTYNGVNVTLIHGFKEYCAFLLFKGALMGDPNGILVHQSKNVQSARQIRFTNVKEIQKLKKVLLSYLYEAIEVEKAGLKVALKKTSEYEVPEEFQQQLNKSAKLKKAFEALTPGRQRAYLLFFSSAKQAKTREARIEKHLKDIFAGKGLND